MIIKYCTKCGKQMTYNGHSMCDECLSKYSQRQRNRIYNKTKRNKQTDRFYHSKMWKSLSQYVLMKANYVCADCGGLATEVHHEKPVAENWNKRFDIDNLTPLCTSCHNRRR
nr:MAG TPA: HNH endonuclease [Caudoviricetes sp.]